MTAKDGDSNRSAVYKLMKLFATPMIGLMLSFCVLGQVPAQQKPAVDWTSLFPEIPGCERVVQPVRREGKIIAQTAQYERVDYKKMKNNPDFPNYFGCGSITLRIGPSIRRNAEKQDNSLNGMMPPQPTRVKGFFALLDGPQCGNDPWSGSTAVYFDDDKVLIASAFIGADKISEFAEAADYRSISRFMKRSLR